jgi:hypothetical protein
MLSKNQEIAARFGVCVAAAVLVNLVYHAIFPRPDALYPYLCWLFGAIVAFNLVWFGLMRLYRRHLQPRILKQC